MIVLIGTILLTLLIAIFAIVSAFKAIVAEAHEQRQHAYWLNQELIGAASRTTHTVERRYKNVQTLHHSILYIEDTDKRIGPPAMMEAVGINVIKNQKHKDSIVKEAIGKWIEELIAKGHVQFREFEDFDNYGCTRLIMRCQVLHYEDPLPVDDGSYSMHHLKLIET